MRSSLTESRRPDFDARAVGLSEIQNLLLGNEGVTIFRIFQPGSSCWLLARAGRLADV